MERLGRGWARCTLGEPILERFATRFSRGRAGERITLGPEVLALLAADGGPNTIARAALPKARPVRVVAFDKTNADNWALDQFCGS